MLDKKTYKHIKNLIHNDYGLTKDEIEQIIREEIAKCVQQYLIKDLWHFENLKKIVSKEVNSQLDFTNNIKYKVMEYIKAEVASRLKINIELTGGAAE